MNITASSAAREPVANIAMTTSGMKNRRKLVFNK